MMESEHYWRLVNHIRDWCAQHGYEFVSMKEYYYREGHHKFELILKDPPPPLGVSVEDRVGVKDVFGVT